MNDTLRDILSKLPITGSFVDSPEAAMAKQPLATTVGAPNPDELLALRQKALQKIGAMPLSPVEQAQYDRLSTLDMTGNLPQTARPMLEEFKNRKINTEMLAQKQQQQEQDQQQLDSLRQRKIQTELSPEQQQQIQAQHQDRAQRIAPFVPPGSNPDVVANLPTYMASRLAKLASTNSETGYHNALAGMDRSKPENQPVGALLPGITDDQARDMFGDGVTTHTPFKIANDIAKLRQKKTLSERMFPITALSPEGQAAARASGMGDYIPESTARIINGANPIKLPSAEETTSLATASSIQSKIDRIKELLPLVKDSALGFGKYQINKYGQFIPMVKSDPNVVEFYTDINSVNNAMIYYMSGKQINENEGLRIKAETLDAELNPDAFVPRLDTFANNFNYLRQQKDQAISGVGRRTPGLGPKPTVTPPPSAQKQYSSAAEVKAAVKRGTISYDDGVRILKDKFGMK